MSYKDIPHNDFQAGFEAGYRAIMGGSVLTPLTPLAPLTMLGMTPFLMGVRSGIEAAGIEIDQ